MNALGRRLPYQIFFVVFIMANASLMNFLNNGYDVAKAQSGPEGAMAFVAVGLAAAGVGALLMIAMLALRLRNADRSGWWAILGFLPFLNFLVFLVAMFLPEEN